MVFHVEPTSDILDVSDITSRGVCFEKQYVRSRVQSYFIVTPHQGSSFLIPTKIIGVSHPAALSKFMSEMSDTSETSAARIATAFPPLDAGYAVPELHRYSYGAADAKMGRKVPAYRLRAFSLMVLCGGSSRHSLDRGDNFRAAKWIGLFIAMYSAKSSQRHSVSLTTGAL